MPVKVLPTVGSLIFSAIISLWASQKAQIGDIQYFGLTGIDIQRVDAALNFHRGDELSFEQLPDFIVRTRESLKSHGFEPTDVAPVCCNEQGNWIIYLGLPGKNLETPHYAKPPTGSIKLPEEAVSLYQQSMDLLFESIQNKATEDRSKGYALSTYPPLRVRQLGMREYATRNTPLIGRVLRESANAQQRAIAAHLLGYANSNSQQIAKLVSATQDIDEQVRNNAVRALGVLGESKSSIAARIPSAGIISMLNSGTWTDRNKAGYLLGVLTKQRDPRLLELLRARATDSLLEMARWREPGHASSARIILGRIAKIDETRLLQLVATKNVDAIIESFTNSR
ncbi:MAG TPA: HEAT repeat domain-containing protein [Pyrinomonadaceae bacterium]|nr:HEAT repeat domain-containing protein [Pyrinomonadaceae bacterium]